MSTLTVRGSGEAFYAFDMQDKTAIGPTHRTQERAEAFIDRQQRRQKVRTRNCLCCTTTFQSEGQHNRLCNECRKGDGVH